MLTQSALTAKSTMPNAVNKAACGAQDSRQSDCMVVPPDSDQTTTSDDRPQDTGDLPQLKPSIRFVQRIASNQSASGAIECDDPMQLPKLDIRHEDDISHRNG